MLRRLAWTLAVATAVLTVCDVVVTAQYRSLTSEAAVAVHGFPLVNAAVLGCAVMGAVVITNDERHVVGWLLTAIGAGSAVSLLTEAYAVWVVSWDGPGPSWLGGVSGWVSSLLGGQLAIAGIAFLFLLAPDGHLLSPRWRFAALVAALGALLCVAALLGTDPRSFDVGTQAERAGPVVSTLATAGFLLVSAGLILSLVSMLLRLRRSTGETRQQVRLIALSAAGVSLGILALLVVQLRNGGQQTWAAALPLFGSFLLLPVLFAVAVLRYRLYDIDVIVDRALLLGAATGFAAVGYTSLVVAANKLVDSQTDLVWLSLLSTAVVAVAFQPLRLRVVGLANRLAYGPRSQPYQRLSDFSRRLAAPPTPHALLSAIAAAAGQELAAPHARAVLASTSGTTAVWGDQGRHGNELHEVTVRSDGTPLGSIAVALPRGRGLRPADRRLLQDLADQAAVALRNAAMEVQLAEHVAALDRTTDELARTRRRLIESDDAVRRDLEAAISRGVLPHLDAVAAQLARVRPEAPPADLDALVDALLAEVTAALEALRALTRGVRSARVDGEPPVRRSDLVGTGHAERTPS